jgi:hypothetical protein
MGQSFSLIEGRIDYIDGCPSGRTNERYFIHAVNVKDILCAYLFLVHLFFLIKKGTSPESEVPR